METNLTQLRLALILQDVLFFVGSSLLIFFYLRWRYRISLPSVLQMRNCPHLPVYLWAVLLILAVQPFMNLCVDLNSHLSFPAFLSEWEQWLKKMEEHSEIVTTLLLSDVSIWGVLANIAVVGGVAALSEEMFFRGSFQCLLFHHHSPHVAIWISACLFSIVHLQFSGFFARMCLGALFGYIVWWSKSLWPAVLMHFINNSSVVIAYCFLVNKGIDIEKMNLIGTQNTWWLGVVSLVISAACVYFLRSSLNVNKTSSLNDDGNSMFRN